MSNLTLVIVVLYSFLFLIQSQNLNDDIGFDFMGYADRAYSQVEGDWSEGSNLGVPTKKFQTWLPSYLPYSIKFLGELLKEKKNEL